ncbi:hypothetical protein [Chlamydiifrater phoenicopteri]|uniref:hypothetical protein n=1 Tax=Chlamydiifrater phoenicopteri TaxID=2681469 RepID=UPI001BD06A3D|nr:hypothetical protein [Chlamydiifrater phoenicopteri]
MSTSKLSELAASIPDSKNPAPWEERIRVNYEFIHEIINTNPLEMLGSEGILCSQLYFVKNKGFSFRLIAEALAISNISLKLILKEQRALSESEYVALISRCHDLSEASGSGTSGTAQLEAPQLQETQEPSTSEEVLEATLPLKKRKLWQTASTTLSTEQQQPSVTKKVQPEESKEAIMLLLDSVINFNDKDRSPVHCPQRGLQRDHVCSKCHLSLRIIKQADSQIIKQLGTFLLFTSRETLATALLSLIGKKRISSLYEKRYLTALEVAYIVHECNLGDEICLPRRRNPKAEVALYQALEDVIQTGLQHPLTKILRQLWETPSPVPRTPTTIAVKEENGSIKILSPETVHAYFSCLTLCYMPKKSGQKSSLSPKYLRFVAEATILSLKALLKHRRAARYVERLDADPVIFLPNTVKHVYGVMLCSHPLWKPEVLLCKASSTRQLLTFSEEGIHKIFPSLKRFVKMNNLSEAGGHFFDEGAPIIEASVPEPIVISSEDSDVSEEEHSSPPSEKSSEESAPKKKTHKTHHTIPATGETMETAAEEDPERQQAIKSISFLLSALEKESPDSPPPDCPEAKSHSPFETSCQTCYLFKLLNKKKYAKILAQIKSFLKFSSSSNILKALLNLFPEGTVSEISKRTSFSNLELSYMLRDCGVGDEVCLPDRSNPAAQADLYYTVNELILNGIEFPLTKTILEIWESSPPVLSSPREFLTPPIVVKEDGSTHVCHPPLLKPILEPLAQRYFDVREGKRKRARMLPKLSTTTINFVAKVTMFTIRAMEKSTSGKTFLRPSSSGLLCPWKVMEHIFCLILSAHPLWKLSVLPSKIHPEGVQELSFPEEEIDFIFSRLQRFALQNHIFLSGSSILGSHMTLSDE